MESERFVCGFNPPVLLAARRARTLSDRLCRTAEAVKKALWSFRPKKIWDKGCQPQSSSCISDTGSSALTIRSCSEDEAASRNPGHVRMPDSWVLNYLPTVLPCCPTQVSALHGICDMCDFSAVAQMNSSFLWPDSAKFIIVH